MPAPFTYGAISAATIASRLNSLATIIDDTRTRLQNAPWVWSRAYAMRNLYIKDGISDGAREPRARPSLKRQGTQLIVRGKGVTMNWGGIALPTNEPGKGGGKYAWDNHTFSNTKSLIDGDKVETKTIYLDTIADLYPGTYYELSGDRAIHGSRGAIMPKGRLQRVIDGKPAQASGVATADSTYNGAPPKAAVPPTISGLTLSSGLTIADRSATAYISATWQAGIGVDPDRYTIQWAEDSAFTVNPGGITIQAPTDNTDPQYTIPSLKPGVVYYVRVAAIYYSSPSAFSAAVSVTTVQDTTPPSAVTSANNRVQCKRRSADHVYAADECQLLAHAGHDPQGQ